MGRYYNGDIEGKFWFAVQSSCDGAFFGMEEQEPSYIPYYSEDLTAAEDGIKECKKELRGYLTKLNKFFSGRGAYNNTTLAEALNLEHEDDEYVRRHLLVWYARLNLGKKIVKCIKENGSCYYDAEI